MGIGKIVEINGNNVVIDLSIKVDAQANLIGVHVVFDDEGKKIVGEIDYLDKEQGKIVILGEFIGDKFLPGVRTKPSFKSTCRIITLLELEIMLGSQTIKEAGKVYFGKSSIYNNFKINIDLNKFFSNHFSIMGNTGSGKSSSFARIIQNVFTMGEYYPQNARMMIFDAYGEYVNAFSFFNTLNPNLATKVLTTNTKDTKYDLLRIPIWLLDVDDVALLLGATEAMQLPIIEKAIVLAPILKGTSEEVIKCRNDIVARAILDILQSGKDSSKIRDQVIAVLTSFSTSELNLESVIHQPGYSRTLKQCLLIDKSGKMQEMELVVSFFQAFVIDGLELPKPDGKVMYDLKDLNKALELALISEGILKSDKIFDYANILSVRLRSLIDSESSEYFTYPEMVEENEYIDSLFRTKENKFAQVVNFNINYVDDRMAKTIVKILSRKVFNKLVKNPIRGGMPIHIIIEEAHRYVQEDNDVTLLGYNIFERITKEGRKYGTILGLITQRPSELSETVVSQCANFIILRTLHPSDLRYIEQMVPNISEESVKQVKTLQPGGALAFGSAFPIAIYMKFDMPNPAPLSASSNITKIWYGLID